MAKNKEITKKTNNHNMRKILPFYAKQKGLFSLLMIMFFVTGALGVVEPVLSATALASLASGDFDKALKFAILMTSTSLFRSILNTIQQYFYVKFNSKIEYALLKKLMHSIGMVKMQKLDSVQTGYLTERISSDVGVVGKTYLDVVDIVFEIVTNAVFLVYIAFLNWQIFLLMMIYVVCLYVLCIFKTRAWIRGRKKGRKVLDDARSAYVEQISGVRDIRLLNIHKNIDEHSNQIMQNALREKEKVVLKRRLFVTGQTLLSASFELAFLIMGIALVRADLLLLAGLLVIYTYHGRVEGLVNYFSSFKEQMAEGEVSASRVFEVIEDYEKESFGTEELEDFSGLIELKDVEFAYDEAKVLKGVNMNFKPGEMTAIVGRSGSGKTTILSLLSKLYSVSGGSLLLDGNNIEDLTEESIRSNIGEVSQMPYIFNTSIRQNLLFVKPDATEKELVSVLQDAQIWDDVKKFKDGIDTVIGKNGIMISGGQRQRIAIARLLLAGSKVIVFDEATSALDNENQSKIVDILEKYKSEKTIIIVAHRLSTIVGADKIYMLKDGVVCGEGTHKMLMQNCTDYKELYELEENSSRPEK